MGKNPWRLLAAAVVPCAVTAGVAVGALPQVAGASGSGTPATATSWTALEQAALSATQGYRAAGPVTAATSPSPAVESTVATASGPITVAERTVVATEGSATLVLGLSLLGGSQLVVSESSATGSGSDAVLVLDPGSSSVAGAVPVATTRAAATSAVRHGRSRITTVDAVRTWRDPSAGRPAETTTGGCAPYPYDPVVVTSIFGPLVDADGVVACNDNETLAEIVSVYQGGTHEGTTNQGTDYGDYLSVNSYAECYPISGTHQFHTAELYSVNGVYQGGATSGNNGLHCN